MNEVGRILLWLVSAIVVILVLQYAIQSLITNSQTPTTVIVERPAWRNYDTWWGYYGYGLPGWGRGWHGPPAPPYHKPGGPSQPPPAGPSQPATPAPAAGPSQPAPPPPSQPATPAPSP